MKTQNDTIISPIEIKGIKHEETVEELIKSLLKLKEIGQIIKDILPVKTKVDKDYSIDYYETMFDVDVKHGELVIEISRAIGFLVAGDITDMIV